MGTINRGTKAAGGSAFAANTTAIAAEVNTDFDNIYNEFNTNIENDNIAAAAAILGTKLAGDAADAAAAQVSEDPFPAGVFSSRANLTEEIRSLRFVLQQAFGHSTTLGNFWYTDAVMFSTGDCKVTLKTTADPGWVLMDTDDGTIGNLASSATKRASADCEELFELLWNNEGIANTGLITNLSRNGGIIASNTVAAATVVTTVDHGLSNGDVINIDASNSEPPIDGVRTITRLTNDTFSVPVNVTIAGTEGTWTQFGHVPSTRCIVDDAAHGLSTGDIILIAGSDSTPSVNGVRTVHVIDANTFAVNTTLTINGGSGTWIRNFIQDSSGNIVDKSDDATAQIAFDANRRLVLPVALGRALAIAGAGGGVRGDDLALTSRALGAVDGNEDHTLSIEQLPSHVHHMGVFRGIGYGGAGPEDSLDDNRGLPTGPSTPSQTKGGGNVHNNMQPSFFVNVMIKL